MTIEITTPPGRIVWGHPTKSRGKTRKNANTGATEAVMKDGVQVQQWSFGVAYDKATFQATIWPAMAQEAATVYPNGQIPPKFAWKYKDGDGPDDQGKPFSDREGQAGCYILAISSELMSPPLFKLVNGAYQQLPADAIKCGDWVSVGLSLKANIPTDRTMTPGLYINPLAIELVGYGTEIQGQGNADPNAIFKGHAHQLPPGASATPIGAGPSAPGMPGMGVQQPPMATPPPAPALQAPMAPPPPPPAPTVPAAARPVDPSHIAPNPAGGELWWNGQAWMPAPQLPPPAPDFVRGAPAMAPAVMPGPGMMPPR